MRMSAPFRTPAAVGVKVTVIEQLAPAATLVPQAFVCVKSPLLVPATWMLARLSVASPKFLKFNPWPVVVPTV